MTRLPFAVLIMASSLFALPAAAQDGTPADTDTINQVIVYGDDKCPTAADGEILVCAKLPEGDRYRVPQIFRGGDLLDPRNQAWMNRVVALERIGRFGTDSCSPTGLGGFTGCTQALLAGAKAERQAADKTDWQAMIADERAKRLGGIDAAAAEVEAAVVAEEQAMEERQRRAAELEERGGAPEGPDAEPLPMSPGP